jgi:hypothetical protein
MEEIKKQIEKIRHKHTIEILGCYQIVHIDAFDEILQLISDNYEPKKKEGENTYYLGDYEN